MLSTDQCLRFPFDVIMLKRLRLNKYLYAQQDKRDEMNACAKLYSKCVAGLYIGGGHVILDSLSDYRVHIASCNPRVAPDDAVRSAECFL